MPKKAFLVTSALVLCVSSSFAGQETLKPPSVEKLETIDQNLQFLSWYGARTPHSGSAVLYEQDANSGFSNYAISTWFNDSAHDYYASSTLAADDFRITAKGMHYITAVYAAGSGPYINNANVIFFDKLKYDRKTGTTKAVVKATCNDMPAVNSNGGDLAIDISSCNSGKFKGGHDYAVSVQGVSAGDSWAWQTNRKQIGRQAFWYGHNNGACNSQLTPVKICFPGAGYGPDFAFAIYGK